MSCLDVLCRSVLSPRSIKDKRDREPLQAATSVADINFPPGRPSADNIQSVCRFGKLRPLYLPRCLPSTGYGWLARQSKAVNRLEKGFKHCCKGKKDVLSCADGKVRMRQTFRTGDFSNLGTANSLNTFLDCLV